MQNEDFKTDEDVILFRKTRENELKKFFFEPEDPTIKRLKTIEESESFIKELEDKGCVIFD